MTRFSLLRDHALRLQARDDALDAQSKSLGGDLVRAGAGRADRRLVADVLQVGAGEARRLRARSARGRRPARAACRACAPRGSSRRPAQVGRADQHLAVEAAGPQQRRVERVEAVGGGDDHDARAPREAVELDEQLVERLVLLAVERDAGALGADGVELVDEDDRRRVLARRLEQLADAGRADAREHLHEARRRLREEGRAATRARRPWPAASCRCPGGPYSRMPFGTRAPSAANRRGLAQELDDLAQLVLGLVGAGDVDPADARVAVRLDGLGLRARHHRRPRATSGTAARAAGRSAATRGGSRGTPRSRRRRRTRGAPRPYRQGTDRSEPGAARIPRSG